MKKYLFLIAWAAGSDGACGVDTKIRSQKDLVKQHRAGNPEVWTIEIQADNEESAWDKGYRAAFFENWIANDTFSDLIALDE